MAMERKRVTLTAIVMPGEAAVVDYIAQNQDAIGYVSMAVLSTGVRPMTVDEIPLSTQTVESEQYPYVRTLSFIVPLEPSPQVQGFVDFVQSSEGQAIVGQRFGRAPQQE
jgi:phosphate transport system substrate-binding protein